MVTPPLRRLATVLLWVTALHLAARAQPGSNPGSRSEAPIRLKAATFRPGRGERPVIPPGLAASRPARGQRAYYVVQFEGPILDAWKQAVTDTGAELLDYIPDFAFKVRMSPEQAALVARLAPVTWVDLFQPAYKLGPEVMRLAVPRLYRVHIERGADVAAVAQAVSASGAQVLGQSGSTMTVAADGAALEAIARIGDVASIENFQLRQKHNEYAGGTIMGADAARAAGFDGSTQTVAVADTGLGGGTLTSAHPDLQPPRLSAIFNWPGTAGGCFTGVSDDGPLDVSTGHGTHTTLAAVGAGGPAGQGRGTAPAASVVFQAVENWAVPSGFCSLVYGIGPGYYLIGIPGDLRQLFQQAYDAGARVHSDSWGTDSAGAYTSDSAEVDDFVWNHRDMTITYSAGNAGTDANADGIVDSGSLGAPASAKNAIAVGASENDRQSRWDCDTTLAYTECAANGGQNSLFTYGATWPDRYPAAPLSGDLSAGNAEQMAAFSSRGPADDGRIKPDVVAPGTWNLSGYSDAYQQQYDSAPNPQNGLYQYDGWGWPLNQNYKYMGGTSMSNPLVAGAAAVVRDYYQKSAQHAASAALVKATLVNSAVDLLDENNDGNPDNAFPIPNVHEGWGRVNVAAAVDPRRRFFDIGSGLTTNTSWVAPVTVRAGTPLKVTLAWSDYPSSTAAARNLVNDLDLRVSGPDGTFYYGNVFSGGWSQAAGAADRANNLENVFIAAPTQGEWVVEVLAYNTPYGPQPFALVIDGDIEGMSSLHPTVTVSATVGTAREAGPVAGTFTLARTGDTTLPLIVTYTTAGTATSSNDYVALPGSITIPGGSSTVAVTVTPVDDQDVEADESVTLVVSPDPAYSVGAPASATVTIVSDDAYSDLIVSALTVPARAAAGEAVVVTDTTKNQGAGPAPSSATNFYLSTNLSIDPADVLLGSRAVPGLAPGGVSTASTSLTIPGGTSDGSYYVLARADGTLAITESVETNNVKFSSLLQIGADLTVSALTAPGTAGAATSIVVTDSTSNQGTAPVPSTVTTFYLSANLSVDATDATLGSRTVPPLAAGATDTASTTLTLPSTLPTGTYYILGQADASGLVPETSESNNVRYSAPLKIGPDLTISAFTVPSVAAAGGTLVVSDTTQNAGGGSAPGSNTVFYLSSNSGLDASDVVLGSRDVSLLAPGAVQSGSTSLSIPQTTATGVYYLLAQADGTSSVPETTEWNNVRVGGPVQIGPDLLISALSVPATAGAGSPMSVSETTRNQGGGAAPASVTTFYLSANFALDAADVPLGSRAVAALASGGSETGSVVVTIPIETPTGTYYVIGQADGTGSLSETSETNNTRISAAIRVGPDLLVSGLIVPTSVLNAGAAMVITDTTLNQGAGAASASSTAFYLSANTTLDGADTRLGSRTVGSLAPGTAQAGSTTVTIPANTAPGTYYVLAQADGDLTVVETNEINNVRVSWIRIGP
jgi:subtilase family serine protease